MKRYGMFVADNGRDWFVSGAPDPRWNDDELGTLRQRARGATSRWSGWTAVEGESGWTWVSTGGRTMNVDPWPSSLSRLMRRRGCASTSIWATARPSPVPAHGVRRAVLAAIKLLEDPLASSCGDAVPVIGDLDLEVAAPVAAPVATALTRTSVPGSSSAPHCQQVVHNLAQPKRIDADRGSARADRHQGWVAVAWAKAAVDALEPRCEVADLAVQAEPPDSSRDVSSRSSTSRNISSSWCVLRGRLDGPGHPADDAVGDQLGVAMDDGQRRAQLVRDLAQELVLEPRDLAHRLDFVPSLRRRRLRGRCAPSHWPGAHLEGDRGIVGQRVEHEQLFGVERG